MRIFSPPASFPPRIALVAAIAATLGPAAGVPAIAAEALVDPDPAALEHFESRIRPILAQECYECHRTGGKRKGGLALDQRDALRAGGDSGPAVVPGHPDESLLLKAIRHDSPDLEMPKAGARLDDDVIADFEQWIAAGAPDPRDAPPSDEEVDAARDWSAVFERRLGWWSFRPIADPMPPAIDDPEWTRSPIDRFIRAGMAGAGLDPAPVANARTVVRRLHFVAVGLPPSPEDVGRFEASWADDPDRAVTAEVDRLLASPRFGERWARHWMDWVRYADSHGSEGDPAIPMAWRYRDFLVRALNDDIPYDRLVREHIAGDLLPDPRIDPVTGLDESALATAHYRFVFHGFAPTDALDELVRFTDNQIDVVTKGFLGLTVSCARCHDHKFDAISQADYYALFGIFASCRPATRTAEPAAALQARDAELAAIKDDLRRALADGWLRELEKGEEAAAGRAPGAAADAKAVPPPTDRAAARWRLADAEDFRAWTRHGSAIADDPSPAGEFAIAPDGDRIVEGIFPAGFVSHRLSSKHSAVLASPSMTIPENHVLWVRAAGGGKARLRYAVQNYPRNGTVYPINELNQPEPRWHRFDLSYWAGDQVHVEIATAADTPVVGDHQRDRSWISVHEVVLLPADAPAPADTDLPPAAGDPALVDAVRAWRDGATDDAAAETLARALRDDRLANSLESLPEVAPLVARYREIEATVPVPTRAPGILDTPGFDQPLFVRGNHKAPAEPVARRFLSAVDPGPYQTDESSGRLLLADDLVRPDNPFTSRVIVNRAWHHVFGRGLFATTDNVGRLGDPPTHPELLDFLARRFTGEQQWSLKELIRSLLTSRTFRLSGTPSEAARASDPDNRWWSHARVRRLEAEAIRDAMLAVSGTLDLTAGGPPDGRDAARRSIYLRVQRNDLDPFLATFDAPEPLTTRGRRNETNVPGQSLTLLNDPFVIRLAGAWADRIVAGGGTDEDRVDRLFREAFGRAPTGGELARALAYLDESRGAAEETLRHRTALEHRLSEAAARRSAILGPVRAALEDAAPDDTTPSGDDVPEPRLHWTFDGSPGGGDGTDPGLHLRNGAVFDGGTLVLDGKGFAESDPLPFDLGAKTLEAWVQLDDLDQRGGGAVSVQTPDGGVFDAIVFGERDPRCWLAGSDGFHRTRGFDGPAETEAVSGPVHIAIAWREDGTIAAFRNGFPYGAPYRANGTATFKAGGATVLFGCRHLPAGGNRLLRGRILEASLHDRALTETEIAARAALRPGTFIPERAVLAALAPAARTEVETLDRELAETTDALATLAARTSGTNTGPNAAWSDLAQSILNLKEFIYIY